MEPIELCRQPAEAFKPQWSHPFLKRRPHLGRELVSVRAGAMRSGSLIGVSKQHGLHQTQLGKLEGQMGGDQSVASAILDQGQRGNEPSLACGRVSRRLDNERPPPGCTDPLLVHTQRPPDRSRSAPTETTTSRRRPSANTTRAVERGCPA